ncbi:MAG: hypothetical protein ACKVG9_03770 [Rhodospirillales bacterium]
MFEIHRFNDAGLKEFSKFIKDTREVDALGGVKAKLPRIVDDPSLIVLVSSTSKIDPDRLFGDRYEMAEYLNSQWKDYSEGQHQDIGIWAWFAATYFDQLRNRKTQRQEHFIPDEYAPGSLSSDLGYRHSVRMPFFLKANYNDAFCKFILTGRPANQMGDPCENCCGNKKIMTSTPLRALMCELYQDKAKMSVKSGAFTKPSNDNRKSTAGRGGAQRLIPNILPRLKKSYDLEAMPVAEIILASGPEINNSRWIK